MIEIYPPSKTKLHISLETVCEFDSDVFYSTNLENLSIFSDTNFPAFINFQNSLKFLNIRHLSK